VFSDATKDRGRVRRKRAHSEEDDEVDELEVVEIVLTTKSERRISFESPQCKESGLGTHDVGMLLEVVMSDEVLVGRALRLRKKFEDSASDG